MYYVSLAFESRWPLPESQGLSHMSSTEGGIVLFPVSSNLMASEKGVKRHEMAPCILNLTGDPQ